VFREITARLYLHVQMMRTALSRFHAQNTPRGRGMFVLLAIVLLIALATGEDILYRTAYFLLFVVVGSFAWIRLSLLSIDMRSEKQPKVAQVGDVLTGSICTRNKSPIPTNWFEVREISSMPGDQCGGVTELPGRWWRDWKTERLCHSRGAYRIGPLVAQTSDPMGLFRAQTTQGDPVTVVVYPRVVELPYFSLPLPALTGEECSRHSPQARTSEVSTIREYSPGDGLSRIHWPSTARCRQLMSREFEAPWGSDVWIVVDLQRKIQEGTAPENTDEYGVAIAASLAHHAIAHDRRTGLIAYGDKEYVLPLGSGAYQMSTVLEMLTWSKAEGDTPLAEVLSANALRFDRFASVIMVTSSAEVEWVSVLEALTCRDVSIAVVLVDPESFGGVRSCLHDVAMRLMSTRIPAYIVRRGDSIPLALSRQMTAHDLHSFEPDNEIEMIVSSSSSG